MRHGTRAAVILGFVIAAIQPASAGPALRGTKVKTKVLTSRAAVARTFGKQVAAQVPAAFDFSLFALVWIDFGTDPDARVHIETVPADRPLQTRHSSAMMVQVTRTRRHVHVQLVSDSPCSGGMQKPQAVMAQCQRSLASSIASAKRVLRVFATPRARLAGARARVMRAPPRP